MFASCEVNNDQRKVTYRISENSTGYKVQYIDENENLITEYIMPASSQDIWSYSFDGKEGVIIYVSSIYNNINDGILIEILLDGKIFKQGSSLYDTLNYVTVSGTIPYQ